MPNSLVKNELIYNQNSLKMFKFARNENFSMLNLEISFPEPHANIKARNRKISGLFYISENFFDKFSFRRFPFSFDKRSISNVFLTLF